MSRTLLAFAFLALFVCSALGFNFHAPNCVQYNSCSSKDWKIQGPAQDSDLVQLLIAVNERNQDTLQTILREVSDIHHPKYGQHLSFEEIGRLMKNQVALDAIENFLKFNGVDSFEVTPNGEFITVDMTVAQASSMLSTNFFRFESPATKQTIVRALQYTIPEVLREHITIVANVISFPITLTPSPIFAAVTPQPKSVDATNGSVYPAFLNSYLNVQNNQVQSSQVTQSLFESGQYFAPTDLQSFQQNFQVTQTTVNTIVGTNKPSVCTLSVNSCAEANLDVQYILSVAQNATTWFWEVGGTGDVFLTWIQAVAANANAPLVHSISYGSLEPEEVASELQEFDQEAGKLGARGITIVVSSGDDGVANFGARNNPLACGFTPSFPATSTNIVALGATQGPESGKPEIMCSSNTGGIITSGGGFSTVFTAPSWQSTAVQGYMNSGVTLPPSTHYNGAGRAYPDIALLGFNYEVLIGGKYYGLSGTSCSAPTFAGVLSLINDARIQAGKSSLGLVTQALYQLGGSSNTIFRDVTSGENNCCASTVCCKYGFFAAVGWDPTTGFGSVDASALLSALLNV
jgi:tripeptidyl-peptidase-1